MTLQQNLSNSMNIIRSSKKQSITEFSEEIGIARSEMQKILNGTCNLRMDTLEHIADQLQIDSAALISSSPYNLHFDFLLSVLQKFEFFSKLSEEKQRKFVDLLDQLLLLISSDQ